MAFTLPTENVNSSSGFLLNIAKWAYDSTYGMFWAGILAAFCAVMYISLGRYTSERAFGFAGMAGLLGSIMLMVLGLMSWKIGIIFIAFGVISLVWMIVKKE